MFPFGHCPNWVGGALLQEVLFWSIKGVYFFLVTFSFCDSFKSWVLMSEKRGERGGIIFYEIPILWSFDETCWRWVRKMYSLLNFQQDLQLIEFEKGGRGLKLALVSDFRSVSANTNMKSLNSWIKACISFRSQTISIYVQNHTQKGLLHLLRE